MGKLTLREAAYITEKNSRTVSKLCQLQDTLDTASENDKEVITAKMDQLKVRVGRRLMKLAKWADAPISDEVVEANRSARLSGFSNVVTRR